MSEHTCTKAKSVLALICGADPLCPACNEAHAKTEARARLDTDRTAKPLTRIIHHPPEGQGAGHPLADPELEDVATGKRTPMTEPRAGREAAK